MKLSEDETQILWKWVPVGHSLPRNPRDVNFQGLWDAYGTEEFTESTMLIQGGKNDENCNPLSYVFNALYMFEVGFFEVPESDQGIFLSDLSNVRAADHNLLFTMQ